MCRVIKEFMADTCSYIEKSISLELGFDGLFIFYKLKR